MKNVGLCISFFVLLASCGSLKQPVQMKNFISNPVVAHRGAFKMKQLPENSIASLKEAIRLQCAGSEFDVRMSADDSLVINHDPHYAGKEIEKTSFSELLQTPLANGEKLPTLRQYLAAGMTNNPGTRLVLEIKPSGGGKDRARLIAERVVRMVQELNAAPYMVYISFDYDMLKKVVEMIPGADTQYLNGDIAPAQLKTDGINGLDYHFSVFKKHPEWIEQAQQNKLVLNAWTVNTKEDMQWLLSNKFQFITTNEPELLFSIWTAMNSAKK